MKPWCIRVLVRCLAALFTSASLCHAGTVDLGVAGHLYGATNLNANQVVTTGFSLDQNTLVSSFRAGIAPEYIFGGPENASYEVTLTGASGTYLLTDYGWSGSTPGALPAMLDAGAYTITFTGGPCPLCAPFDETVGWIDYYAPVTLLQVGGTTAYSNYGWELTGTTVPATATPEPGTWALLAIGLLCLPWSQYLRRTRPTEVPITARR